MTVETEQPHAQETNSTGTVSLEQVFAILLPYQAAVRNTYEGIGSGRMHWVRPPHTHEERLVGGFAAMVERYRHFNAISQWDPEYSAFMFSYVAGLEPKRDPQNSGDILRLDGFQDTVRHQVSVLRSSDFIDSPGWQRELMQFWRNNVCHLVNKRVLTFPELEYVPGQIEGLSAVGKLRIYEASFDHLYK